MSQLVPMERLELFTAGSYGSKEICLFKGLHLFRHILEVFLRWTRKLNPVYSIREQSICHDSLFFFIRLL